MDVTYLRFAGFLISDFGQQIFDFSKFQIMEIRSLVTEKGTFIDNDVTYLRFAGFLDII